MNAGIFHLLPQLWNLIGKPVPVNPARGANSKTNGAEPPPNLGQMDDRQFADYRRQFGF